jgi:hypothetical protein
MKLGYVALKLRLANTRFINRIGGAAAMALALDSTLADEMLFIIPLSETVTPNEQDNNINQIISEKFGVVVALRMDDDSTDKTGIKPFDKLQDVRDEIFGALLGWEMPDAESLCSFAGGRLLDFNRAWMWYQFEFLVKTRIEERIMQDETDVGWLKTIYAQYVLGEYDEDDSTIEILRGGKPLLPVEETDPISGIRLVDMTQIVEED